eukprot:3317855-Pleurochrysis_carterae.AAC.1
MYERVSAQVVAGEWVLDRSGSRDAHGWLYAAHFAATWVRAGGAALSRGSGGRRDYGRRRGVAVVVGRGYGRASGRRTGRGRGIGRSCGQGKA